MNGSGKDEANEIFKIPFAIAERICVSCVCVCRDVRGAKTKMTRRMRCKGTFSEMKYVLFSNF